MSAAADPLVALAPERRLSGATLIVLAFVMGTLFALLPMYYLYTTRGSGGAVTSPLAAAPASSVANDAPVRDAASGTASARFAARMTYELSHTPAEPPPAPVRVTAKAEPIVPRAVPAAVQPPPQPPRPDPSPRVANARPIIATPPDPRDTTREMEREARRPDYREPPRQVAQVTVETPAMQPKVVEGRDFVLPPKAVPTRPIAAAENDKRVPEAAHAGRTTVATATVIPGTTPIAPPPEAKAPAETPKPKPEAAPADVLASRLNATREWLAGAAQTTHTIQLMGSGSEEHLRNQLKALGKQLDATKIYVFRTVAQGKPSMTVVYGAFTDKAAAVQALEKLPPTVAANKPVLRTVNGIRAEQKQHGAS